MAIWHKAQWHNISSVVTNPAVVELNNLWLSASGISGLLPSSDLLGPQTLPRHSQHLMMLVAQGADFRYVHYGAEIARHSQFDMTGNWYRSLAVKSATFSRRVIRKWLTSASRCTRFITPTEPKAC